MQDALLRLRYRYWPDHLLGEILSKRWTETAIPVIVLLIITFLLSRAIPGFLSVGGLADTGRQAGEIGFIVLGMALVVIVGGIDLSVGSMFALCDFCALFCLNVLDWPVPAVIVATLVCGAALGAVNGLLIGYLRLRAFITTLITLIIYRSAYDLLLFDYSNTIAAAFPDFPSWNFVGGGVVAGVPSVVLVYIVVAIFGHVFLTRLRPGWHVTAIGGSRRSAYNSGIPVRRTIALCYTASGVLTSIGALFFAARLGTVGGDVGVGLEVTVLTATVLGGISLGGGKGSVAKALVGTLIVLFVINGLTTLSVSGGVNRMVLAGVLLVAATIDIRWLKNRNRIISKVYVSPTYHGLAPAASTAPGSGPFAQNDKLRDVTLIGLGRIEAPEDVILDRNDNLYAGSRHGDIMRFKAPDYQEMEVFAHIGGQPLGMAFDRKDNLYVCIGGMGLYRITPERKVEKVTDETNRSLYSVNDDSRLRLADDLDIADDGRIFFSEATVRYEMDEWPVDGLEARGNGRIICYDPNTNTTRTVLRGLKFPNGICIASDGQSILFAETFGCSIKRYWFDGPKTGKVETVIDNLPGYPDNINLASDGNYWLAMVGMRSPALDLAWKMPGFRLRMGKRVPIDEWLFPNINTGCVIKFNEARRSARILLGPARRQPSDDHLDARASRLSLSRRHRQQPDRPLQARWRRPGFRPVRPALGEGPVIAALKSFTDRLLGRGDATITVPSFDGALKPNQILEKAEIVAQFEAPEDLATDGKTLYIADGARVLRLDGAATAEIRRFDRPITALCCLPDGGIAVALEGREVQVFATPSAPSPALTFSDASMHAINALAPGPAEDAGRNRRLDRAPLRPMGARSDGTRPHRTRPCPRSRKPRHPHARFGACATPSAPAPGANDLFVSESWRHRVIALGADGSSRTVLEHLPVYPSRLSPAPSGGFWLTAFTARTQLVEFVLRENAYRRRMMAEIEPEYWIAPKLQVRPVLPRADAGRAHQDHGRRQAVGAAALLRPRHPARCRRRAALRAAFPGRRRQSRHRSGG